MPVRAAISIGLDGGSATGWPGGSGNRNQESAVGANEPGSRGGRVAQDSAIEGLEILMQDRYTDHAVELSVLNPPTADHEAIGPRHCAREWCADDN
jgi:hypothetical protein